MSSQPTEFSGKLLGNKDASITFPRQGFHFVANSWVAPINTVEVLNQVAKLKNADAAEAALKIYISEDATIGGEKYFAGNFEDITREALSAADDNYKSAWGTIQPMQAFFLFANTPATIALSYENVAWNTMLARKAAPKYAAEEAENVAVRIKMTAQSGRNDKVYIYEGEPFHSTKMMNEAPNVNIYVETEAGNYSTYATENLEGTVLKIQTNADTEYTLSFDWLKGETIYIKDMETNVVTAMTKDNTYTFTAAVNTTTRRFIITHEDVSSNVENAIVESAAKGVYTITGLYLGENIDLNTLPQGIYVVDGQKYIK